jgi:hypothetical protein
MFATFFPARWPGLRILAAELRTINASLASPAENHEFDLAFESSPYCVRDLDATYHVPGHNYLTLPDCRSAGHILKCFDATDRLIALSDVLEFRT